MVSSFSSCTNPVIEKPLEKPSQIFQVETIPSNLLDLKNYPKLEKFLLENDPEEVLKKKPTLDEAEIFFELQDVLVENSVSDRMTEDCCYSSFFGHAHTNSGFIVLAYYTEFARATGIAYAHSFDVFNNGSLIYQEGHGISPGTSSCPAFLSWLVPPGILNDCSGNITIIQKLQWLGSSGMFSTCHTSVYNFYYSGNPLVCPDD